MTVREQVVHFDCQGEQLLGIVSQPTLASSLGVVIVVGGPQYRAGSHRQFVLLARALAAGGHTVLRFDYRGMGDGTGSLHNFEQVDDDIGAAIAALRQHAPNVQKVVLWGLCDGASAALMYWQARRDPAVAGLCLANPWLRSEEGQARTQVKHYYTQRLKERAFWMKLLSGKVAASAVTGLIGALRKALAPSPSSKVNATGAVNQKLPYPLRMAQAWQSFPGPILLLISGQDYTAKEFLDTAGRDEAWRGALNRAQTTREDLAEADHTFSEVGQARQAEALTLKWLNQLSMA
jgi:exosortase A-associated hydrolase 1